MYSGTRITLTRDLDSAHSPPISGPVISPPFVLTSLTCFLLFCAGFQVLLYTSSTSITVLLRSSTVLPTDFCSANTHFL